MLLRGHTCSVHSGCLYKDSAGQWKCAILNEPQPSKPVTKKVP